jgi:hypothetical protein
MAWTITREQSVLGNKRVVFLNCVADAATSAIETGLAQIDAFAVGAKSFTSGAPKIYPNVGVTGTATAGTLGATGFTSGDELFITVFGR